MSKVLRSEVHEYASESATSLYSPMLREAIGYTGDFNIEVVVVHEVDVDELIVQHHEARIVFPNDETDVLELKKREALVNLFNSLINYS